MISPRDPTAIDRSEEDRLSDCRKIRRKKGISFDFATSTVREKNRSTHVVLSNERKELSERSSEVGSKNGSEGSNKVGSVGDESRLVLGRVGISLVNLSLVGVRILLAERLALEDLGSVESDLLEL